MVLQVASCSPARIADRCSLVVLLRMRLKGLPTVVAALASKLFCCSTFGKEEKCPVSQPNRIYLVPKFLMDYLPAAPAFQACE